MENKIHWTQTPEGKARISKISKARWKARRGKSRADLVVAAAVKKSKGSPLAEDRRDRFALYTRAARMAARYGEAAEVVSMIANELKRVSLALEAAVRGVR